MNDLEKNRREREREREREVETTGNLQEKVM